MHNIPTAQAAFACALNRLLESGHSLRQIACADGSRWAWTHSHGNTETLGGSAKRYVPNDVLFNQPGDSSILLVNSEECFPVTVLHINSKYAIVSDASARKLLCKLHYGAQHCPGNLPCQSYHELESEEDYKESLCHKFQTLTKLAA